MNYDEILLLFCFSFFFSTVIGIPIIAILYKYKVWKRRLEVAVQIENQALKKNTPILGGLIFVVGITVTTMLFNWERQYTYVPVGVLILSFLLGAADDLLSIFSRQRAFRTIKDSLLGLSSGNIGQKIVHFLSLPWRAWASLFSGFKSSDRRELFAHERIVIYLIIGATVAWWFYYKVDWVDKSILWLPFNWSIYIGPVMIAVIILVVVGMSIAVNITDGLDGLVTSISIPAFMGYAIIAALQGLTSITLFCVTVVGALFAFLYFNVKPARVWMGDAGAVAIGATLAIIAIITGKIVLLLPIGALFIIDFMSSFIQVYGVKLFHKRLLPYAPLHHWFEKIGWDEGKIVARAMIIEFILVVISIWLSTK